MEEVYEEIREINKRLNDLTHTVARLEESVEWIKRTLKWGFTIMGFLMGLIIGLL